MHLSWAAITSLVVSRVLGLALGVAVCVGAWNDALKPWMALVAVAAVLCGFVIPTAAGVLMTGVGYLSLVAAGLAFMRGDRATAVVALAIALVSLLGSVLFAQWREWRLTGPTDETVSVGRPRGSARGRAGGLVLMVAGIGLFAAMVFVPDMLSALPKAAAPAPSLPTATASATAASSPDGYALRMVEGKLIRWDPCVGPISVQLNYGSLAPAFRIKAKNAVAAGLAKIRAATGIKFVYAGGSTDTFPKGTYSGHRQGKNALVIAFLPKGKGIMKVGSSDQPPVSSRFDVQTRRVIAADTGNADWAEIVAADVQIAPKIAGFDTEGYGEPVLWGLASAMGLEELKAPDTNVMSTEAALDLAAYGPGDLAGLATVGADQGCLR